MNAKFINKVQFFCWQRRLFFLKRCTLARIGFLG